MGEFLESSNRTAKNTVELTTTEPMYSQYRTGAVVFGRLLAPLKRLLI
jgi:hypothetical protein